MIRTFFIQRTDEIDAFETKARHFLMEYFCEAPDIPFIISNAVPLLDRYDEVKEFIGDKDVMSIYVMVKDELKKAIFIDNDIDILFWVYQLEDVLYRSYHPKYPCYDLCGSWVYPTRIEAVNYMVVEVTIDHPNNFE